jgi:putative membrane protein
MNGLHDAGSDPEAGPQRDDVAPPTLEDSGRRLVYLAAERTVLTWVRAAIALILLGFAVDRFDLLLPPGAAPAVRNNAWSSWLGLTLVGLGVLTSAASGFRYGRFARRFAAGDPRPGPGIPLAVGLCLLLALAGAALAGYLSAVSG